MRLAAGWLPLFVFWAGSAEATDCAGSLTINGPDDVAKLNQCTTFDGNVSVAATGTTDLALNGLKEVTGILSVADSDAVQSISSATLESISTLMVSSLPSLTTLALPALGNITKLTLNNLKSLRGCDIATQGLKQDISEINIINTAIEKLDWLRWPVTTNLNIAANMNLTDFTFPYSTINTGSTYQISVNSALDNLNLSQLTGIAGSLAINGNNDKDLQFDRLETIDGYVKLDGAYSNITMPRLVSINGALRASSTINILPFCNWLSIQGRLLGHYDCTANNTNPAPVVTSTASTATLKTSGSSQTGISSKSDLSTGAIIGIAMGMVVLISIILTSLALLFLRRRSQKKQAPQVAQENPASEDKKTHSTSTLGEELDASGVRYELGGGQARQTHELPEAKPVTELDGQTFQELESEKPYFRDQKPAIESPIGRFELP